MGVFDPVPGAVVAPYIREGAGEYVSEVLRGDLVGRSSSETGGSTCLQVECGAFLMIGYSQRLSTITVDITRLRKVAGVEFGVRLGACPCPVERIDNIDQGLQGVRCCDRTWSPIVDAWVWVKDCAAATVRAISGGWGWSCS